MLSGIKNDLSYTKILFLAIDTTSTAQMTRVLLIVTLLLPLVFAQTRPMLTIAIFPDTTCQNRITTYGLENNPSLCQSLPSVSGGIVHRWPGYARCQQGMMLLSYCRRQDNATDCGDCETPVQVSIRSRFTGCDWEGVIGASVRVACPPDNTILVEEGAFAVAWTGFCVFFVLAVVFLALYIHQRRSAVKMYKNAPLAEPLM